MLVAAASIQMACTKAAPGPDPGADASPPPAVVARAGDIEITAAEVDARVLALPASERPGPGTDLDQWYRGQIREMVIDRMLLAGARSHDFQGSDAFATGRREAERTIGLQLCVATLRPALGTISEGDLGKAFEAHSEELAAPARRSVYQIFLRRGPGARRQLEEIRQRVLAGESFSRLAARYSESETRHRNGFVGWMVPGRLPRGFEKVVFSLEERVPSRIVTTRQGFDLFYVDEILPPRTLGFEEARPILLERLRAERGEAALGELDADFQAPPGSLVLDREQLTAVMKAGDPEAPVLRIGEESWTLADLRRRVQEFMARQATGHGVPTFELGWQILERARRREELFLGCRSRGSIPEEELASRLDEWQRRALIDAERHQRLVDLALHDEERLRTFYESNLGEYSTPPTWTIRLLQVPLGAHPAAAMARLERAAATPATTLETLRSELGGTIKELEPETLAELGGLRPKLPGLIAPLEKGQLAAPYRTEDGLEIAEVVGRTPAEPIPFEKVRDRVAARYVQQYTSELYATLRREMLPADDLEVDPEALAKVRRGGLARPDVSVDQLESLLDQM